MSIELENIRNNEDGLGEKELQEVVKEVVTSAIRTMVLDINLEKDSSFPRFKRSRELPDKVMPVGYDSMVRERQTHPPVLKSKAPPPQKPRDIPSVSLAEPKGTTVLEDLGYDVLKPFTSSANSLLTQNVSAGLTSSEQPLISRNINDEYNREPDEMSVMEEKDELESSLSKRGSWGNNFVPPGFLEQVTAVALAKASQRSLAEMRSSQSSQEQEVDSSSKEGSFDKTKDIPLYDYIPYDSEYEEDEDIDDYLEKKTPKKETPALRSPFERLPPKQPKESSPSETKRPSPSEETFPKKASPSSVAPKVVETPVLGAMGLPHHPKTHFVSPACPEKVWIGVVSKIQCDPYTPSIAELVNSKAVSSSFSKYCFTRFKQKKIKPYKMSPELKLFLQSLLIDESCYLYSSVPNIPLHVTRSSSVVEEPRPTLQRTQSTPAITNLYTNLPQFDNYFSTPFISDKLSESVRYDILKNTENLSNFPLQSLKDDELFSLKSKPLDDSISTNDSILSRPESRRSSVGNKRVNFSPLAPQMAEYCVLTSSESSSDDETSPAITKLWAGNMQENGLLTNVPKESSPGADISNIMLADINSIPYSCQISETSSRVPDTSSRVPDTSSRVPDTSSRVPDTSSRVPDTSSRVPDTSSRVPDTSSRVPDTSSRVPDTSSRVPDTSSRVPDTSSRVPDTSSRVPDTSSRVPDTSSRVPDTSSRVPDTSSRVPDTSSRVPDTSSRVPDANSRVPDANSRVPDASLRVPDASLRVPDTSLRVPDTSSRVPDTSSRVPDTSARVPDASARVPDASSRVPDASSRVPDASSRVPDASSRVPDASSRVPDASSRVPDTSARVPDTSARVPDTSARVPDTNARVADTSLRVPDTSLRVPDTSSRVPDTSSRVPDTSSRVPDTSSRVPDTSSRIPDTSSRIPDTSSRIPDTSSRIPDTSLRVPDTSLRVPDTSLRVPDTSLRVHDTSSRVPDTSSRVPDTSSSVPDTSSRVPDTSSRVPDTSSRVPDTSSRVPDTSSRVPDTSSRVPDTSSRVPDTSSRVPDTSSRVPDTSSRVPDTSSRVPDTSSRVPDTSFRVPDTRSKDPDTRSSDPDTRSRDPDMSISDKITGIPDTTAGIPDTTAGIPDTTAGIPDTTSGIPDTTAGIPDTTAGIPDTTAGIPDTTAGIPDTTAGIPDTTAGIPDTTAGIPVTTAGIPDTTAGIPDTTAGISDTIAGIPDTTAGIPDTSAGIPDTSAGIPDTSAGIPDTSAGIPDTSAGIPSTSAGIPSTSAGIPSTSAGIPDTIAGIPDTIAGIPDTIAGIPDTIAGIPDTIAGIPDTSAGIPDTSAGIPDTSACIPDTSAGIPDTSAGIPDTSAGIPDSSAGIPDASAGIPDASAGIPDASAGIPDASAGIPDASAGIPDASAGIPDASAGIPDESAGIPDTSAGIPKLSSRNITTNTSNFDEIFETASLISKNFVKDHGSLTGDANACNVGPRLCASISDSISNGTQISFNYGDSSFSCNESQNSLAINGLPSNGDGLIRHEDSESCFSKKDDPIIHESEVQFLCQDEETSLLNKTGLVLKDDSVSVNPFRNIVHQKNEFEEHSVDDLNSCCKTSVSCVINQDKRSIFSLDNNSLHNKQVEKSIEVKDLRTSSNDYALEPPKLTSSPISTLSQHKNIVTHLDENRDANNSYMRLLDQKVSHADFDKVRFDREFFPNGGNPNAEQPVLIDNESTAISLEPAIAEPHYASIITEPVPVESCVEISLLSPETEYSTLRICDAPSKASISSVRKATLPIAQHEETFVEQSTELNAKRILEPQSSFPIAQSSKLKSMDLTSYWTPVEEVPVSDKVPVNQTEDNFTVSQSQVSVADSFTIVNSPTKAFENKELEEYESFSPVLGSKSKCSHIPRNVSYGHSANPCELNLTDNDQYSQVQTLPQHPGYPPIFDHSVIVSEHMQSFTVNSYTASKHWVESDSSSSEGNLHPNLLLNNGTKSDINRPYSVPLQNQSFHIGKESSKSNLYNNSIHSSPVSVPPDVDLCYLMNASDDSSSLTHSEPTEMVHIHETYSYGPSAKQKFSKSPDNPNDLAYLQNLIEKHNPSVLTGSEFEQISANYVPNDINTNDNQIPHMSYHQEMFDDTNCNTFHGVARDLAIDLHNKLQENYNSGGGSGYSSDVESNDTNGPYHNPEFDAHQTSAILETLHNSVSVQHSYDISLETYLDSSNEMLHRGQSYGIKNLYGVPLNIFEYDESVPLRHRAEELTVEMELPGYQDYHQASPENRMNSEMPLETEMPSGKDYKLTLFPPRGIKRDRLSSSCDESETSENAPPAYRRNLFQNFEDYQGIVFQEVNEDFNLRQLTKKPKVDMTNAERGRAMKSTLKASHSLPTLCSFYMKRNLEQWVTRTQSVPLNLDDDDWIEYSDDQSFSGSEFSSTEHILLVRN